MSGGDPHPKPVMSTVARRCYQAYADSDQSAIGPLVADDFHFTSPLDNRIDRAMYFERCWPKHDTILGFELIHPMSEGDRVFVTYEALSKGGKRFWNSEVLTVRDGQLVDAEVHFGWNVPHEAPAGGSIASGQASGREEAR